MIPLDTVLIGVYEQPATSLQKWADRGINTLVGIAQGQNRLDAFNAATNAKIRVLAAPDPVPAIDVSIPAFLGWNQPDEPENQNHVPNLDYNAAAEVYVKRFLTLKAANAKAANTPIFGNFNGMVLTAAREAPPAVGTWTNIVGPQYRRFFEGVDWLCADWYVRNSGRTPDRILPLISAMMQRLNDWSFGKPSMAFIECSFQGRTEVGSSAPTPSEMRATIWTSLIFGAKGIVYFPAKVGGGFKFDNTTPEIVEEMKRCNSELKLATPYILNGVRTITNGAGSASAIWKDSVGRSISASVKFDSVSKTWTTEVDLSALTDVEIAKAEILKLKTENSALTQTNKDLTDTVARLQKDNSTLSDKSSALQVRIDNIRQWYTNGGSLITSM
jgi:FtsZ-binding cell division protein ZapB